MRKRNYAFLAGFVAAGTLSMTMAAAVETGDQVRIQSTALADGWHEGTLVEKEKCLSVSIRTPTNAGRTSVVLGQVDRLEVKQSEAWVAGDLVGMKKNQSTACASSAKDADKKSEKDSVH